MTAARVMCGATSLSSSSHFPLKPYSIVVNPVALPPGRAKLATKPALTGSITCTNTIGMVRVIRCKGSYAAAGGARIMSGASATNSAAYLAMALVCATPTIVDPDVAARSPPASWQTLCERGNTSVPFRIISS